MIIRINHIFEFYNGGDYYQETRIYECEYDVNRMLKDVLQAEPYGKYILNNFYNLSNSSNEDLEVLPYIVEDNKKVVWNVDIDNVKLADFIRTHNIKDEFTVKTFIAEGIGGCINYKDVVDLWNAFYPVIVDVANNLGYFYIGIETIKHISKLFIKKNVKPLNLIDFIYSRDYWNHHELSELFGVSKNEAKRILNTFGYKWDNHKKLYVVVNKEYNMNRFMKVDVYSKKIP